MRIKSIIKLVIYTALLSGTVSSCRNAEADKAAVAKGEMVYMCPMDCEKGKYYEAEGRCPVCGMKLKLKTKPIQESKEYKMTFSSNPVSISSGQAASLSFKPTIVGSEAEAVALDVQHEKKIHLIVVSKDLNHFDHIHPEYQADGSYLISVLPQNQPYKTGPGHQEVKFLHGGEYTLFADYLPSGGPHQVEKITLNVSGKPTKEIALVSNKWEGQSGDYTVKLTSNKSILKSGEVINFSGVVTDKTGKVVDPASIENYLGAKAHAVIVSVVEKEYQHVHPEVINGKFDLNTSFAKPGMYKGWIQFQILGKVHTADFVFKAE
jgi:hypothetical protein